MANDWNVKRLLKQIVMSATYRQSSHPTRLSLPTRKTTARPRAALSAHGRNDPRQRSTSGLISTRMGGGGSKPCDLTESFKPMGHDKGEGFTGSVYTFWKRTGPGDDGARRQQAICRAKRETTATPLQALVLMNGPQFVEAARMLGKHGAGTATTFSRSSARPFAR